MGYGRLRLRDLSMYVQESVLSVSKEDLREIGTIFGFKVPVMLNNEGKTHKVTEDQLAPNCPLLLLPQRCETLLILALTWHKTGV